VTRPARRARAGRVAAVAVAVAVGGALGLAACGSDRPVAVVYPAVQADIAATGIPSFYEPPRPLPRAAPGTIIRAETVVGVPGVPAGATVWRILYHSRSIYGADIAESGYVVAPAGRAPAGGRPVLTWAHGTTGFAGICAPSLFSMQGVGGVYLVPGLADFLRAGFVIAATDYEGLGTPGIHPYLVGESGGRAVLDAARAARRLSGLRTSRTVIIYGHSEGGHAALFAGELAPSYAPELHVAGVVAAAPATGLPVLLTVATSSLGQNILGFAMPAAFTWVRTYRDLPSSDVFTPTGARVAASVVPTGCEGAVVTAIADQHLTPGVIFRADAATMPSVVAHARLNDPGRRATQAPMLVVQGTADTVVPPALTDAYVTTKACPIGDRIEYQHVSGANHTTVVVAGLPAIEEWTSARLRGDVAPTTCGRTGDVTTIAS
jgi:alpha-beta hydrolase superfamily lysophospholipase